MKVTFYLAAFFAIICSLQHMVLAVDGTEDSADHEKPAEAKEVPEAEVEKSAGDYEADSDEYNKHMEKLSATAVEEHGEHELTEKEKAEFAEMDKMMAAETAESKADEKRAAESKVDEELKDEDAHLTVEDSEKGMKNPPEEEEPVEEIALPTKYPEINPEMTHVNLVEVSSSDQGTNEVHLTLEYSYFKGADAYEICGDCEIEDGERVNAETGEVKRFSKEDEMFCETSPACFAEFTWKTGGTTFSMRAHTDNGYTQWGPNLKFHVEGEVGPVTHNEL